MNYSFPLLTYSPSVPHIPTETTYERAKFRANHLTTNSIGNNPIIELAAILDSKPNTEDTTGDTPVLVQWNQHPWRIPPGKTCLN